MRLSIIIVNYNVRHFLEQALGSVRRALLGIQAEVWVVAIIPWMTRCVWCRKNFPKCG